MIYFEYQHQADDGKAVALLLADLALRDARQGLDRGALQEAVVTKKKAKKRAIRQARKQLKEDLPFSSPAGG